MADHETLVADPIPSAVFKFGYFSRDFNTDLLSDVLPILLTDDRIQQTSLLAIQQTAFAIMQGYGELVTDRAKADSSYETTLSLDIRLTHLPALRTMADRAVTPAHPYRTLYEFGAAIGDYVAESERCKTPDSTKVWRSLCAVPARSLDGILILKELAKTTPKVVKASTLETVIENALLNASDHLPTVISTLYGKSPPIFRFVTTVSIELEQILWPAETKWISSYLGLQFNDEQRRVKRHSYDTIITLPKLDYGLLRQLAAKKEKRTTIEELANDWHKWGKIGRPTHGTIRTAVDKLGEKLRDLNIDTKGERNDGWVLVDQPAL